MDRLHSFLYALQFRRNAVWQIPLLLIITYPLWSIPVGNFLAPRAMNTTPATTSQNERNFSLQGVKITLNRNGMKTAFIVSSSARTNSAEILMMEDVIAELYDKNGDITQIRARHGEYNTKIEQLVLQEDVVVHKTKDQQVLYTDTLYFNNIKQTVFCPTDTQIIANGATLNGGNFSYDIKSAVYNLGKPVRCRLTDFSSHH